MTAHDKPVESDPRLIVAEPRWLRAKTPIRWGLRFGLRTVFATLLLVCVALTIAYYTYFRTRSALRGPTLRLHANGSVSLGRQPDQPLSNESLAGLLDRAMKRYRVASGETGVEIERAGWVSWDNPYGPPVRLAVDPQATHKALDSLLHTCVDHGFERYVLTDATDSSRSFSFVLVKDLPCEGLPNPDELPPVILHLRTAEDGSLSSLRLNQRHLRSFAALRKYLINIIGPERGPNSVQAWIELQMRCDKNLKVRHVFDARETVAGYKTKDGKWVALIDRVRPVDWGNGLSWVEIDVIDCTSVEITVPEVTPPVAPADPR